MSTTGTLFSGPVEDTAANWQPFIRATSKGTGDPTLGFRKTDNSPWGFHPWRMHAEGRTESLVCMCIGQKNHGKTSLGHAMGLTLGTLDVAGEPLRIIGEDMRRNLGEPEYQKLAEYLGSTVVEAGNQQLNLLDPDLGLTFSDYLETIVDAHYYGNENRPLERHQQMTLQVALDALMSDPDIREYMSLDELALFLSTQTGEDFANYLGKHHQSLESKPGTSETYRQAIQRRQQRKLNIDAAAFEEDSMLVAERFTRMLKGDFGEMLGSGRSFAEAMSQRAVFIDYSMMNDRMIALFQAFLWRLKLRSHLNRDRRFVFNLEIQDEDYKFWDILPYAIGKSDYIKQIRAYPTLLVMMTHRRKDYQSVGNPGSTQRMRATNMLNDVGMWFIGALDKADADETCEALNIPDDAKQVIMRQKPGEWTVKIGNEPVEHIYIPRTEDDMAMTDNNKARDYVLGNQYVDPATDEETVDLDEALD